MNPEELYLGLLQALPDPFRDQFEADMRETVSFRAELARRSAASKAGSGLRMGAFWTRELADLGVTVVREHARARQGWVPRNPRPGWNGNRGWGGEMMEDVKLAFRGLRRNPMFSAIVVLTLALGIGLNTAIFSLVDTMVLRPLPYPQPEQLVHFMSVQRETGSANFRMAYADFDEYTHETSSFEALGGYRTGEWVLSGADRAPSREPFASVTHRFFDVLGVAPLLGRTFDPSEHVVGQGQVVILSHQLWTREFGSDPGVLGTTIALGQEPYEVIGIMPAGFDYPFLTPMGGWAPLAHEAFDTTDPNSAFSARDWISINVVARLAGGTDILRAQDEVDVISAGLSEAYPETNRDLAHIMQPLQQLETRNLRKPMLLTLGAVGLILLIACVNVASLLLARGAARQAEVAMRTALGAGRGRLVRLFLTESMVYAVLGGALGIGLGVLLLRVVPTLGLSAPLLDHVRFDMRVFAIVGGATLAVGVLFGILPALRGSRAAPGQAMRGTGRGGRAQGGLKIHRLLIGAELAMTTVLAIGAGLLTNSLLKTLGEDPGFDPAGVLTLRLSLPSRYMQDPADAWSGSNQFFNELVDEVKRVPGVASVGLSYTNPLEPQTAFNTPIEIPGWLERPRPEQPQVNIRPADPGFFEVFDLAPLKGRVVTADDLKSSEGVAVINQAMADLVFGDEDPIGYEVTGPNFWGADGYPYPWRIVGVVPDVKSAGLTLAPAPALYLPFTQAPMGNMRLMVRTSGDPEALAPEIRERIWAMDNAVPVDGLTTMEQEISNSVATSRFAAMAVGIFALVAIILAAIGVYGVLSYSVGLRHGEFGIRQALGADQEEILKLVIGQGLRVALLGISVGLVAAGLTSRVLESFLYGVTGLDPVTYGTVGLALLGIAVIACVVPARRATTIEPATALRSD